MYLHETLRNFPGGACQFWRYTKHRLDPWSGRFPGGRHATRSSILAWRIPWTEEPGGLQSIGLQRVGHD